MDEDMQREKFVAEAKARGWKENENCEACADGDPPVNEGGGPAECWNSCPHLADME